MFPFVQTVAIPNHNSYSSPGLPTIVFLVNEPDPPGGPPIQQQLPAPAPPPPHISNVTSVCPAGTLNFTQQFSCQSVTAQVQHVAWKNKLSPTGNVLEKVDTGNELSTGLAKRDLSVAMLFYL
jgi:hypothetical protein